VLERRKNSPPAENVKRKPRIRCGYGLISLRESTVLSPTPNKPDSIMYKALNLRSFALTTHYALRTTHYALRTTHYV